MSTEPLLSRAQGCLAGQIAGDSLGSLVEFESPASIARRYPDGPRQLAAGGVWDTLPGQPTDDSELALALARSLAAHGRFDEAAVAQAYRDWYASAPFDVGSTTRAALDPAWRGGKNRQSQANGALMRVSPLGIFGVRLDPAALDSAARADAALTHPHPVCRDASAVFARSLADAIRGADARQVYHRALACEPCGEEVRRALQAAASSPPSDFMTNQGWVLLALQNAYYQLLHAPDFEQGVVDTVRGGGDTDTNAAIAGALLGAVYGLDAVPRQWLDAILDCRPAAGLPGVCRPRPEIYWPVDILPLARVLVGLSA